MNTTDYNKDNRASHFVTKSESKIICSMEASQASQKSKLIEKELTDYSKAEVFGKKFIQNIDWIGFAVKGSYTEFKEALQKNNSIKPANILKLGLLVLTGIPKTFGLALMLGIASVAFIPLAILDATKTALTHRDIQGRPMIMSPASEHQKIDLIVPSEAYYSLLANKNIARKAKYEARKAARSSKSATESSNPL
jgi:hypothetical protein